MLRAARLVVWISEISEHELLSVSPEQSPMFKRFKQAETRAMVHFIPDLKVGVFVTLRAPEVISRQLMVDLAASEYLYIS